jgi:deazaflavin-dependent oxidoreductase (nitroreductase family)
MGNRAYDVMWGAALRTTTVAHRIVHRLSGGRLWRRFPGGAQVIWVTTLGRRSGEWRTNPLLAVPDEAHVRPGVWAVTGSNAGQEKVPGWVYNMRAHAHGRMEIDGQSMAVTFEEVTGTDADRLYEALTDKWSAYRMYKNNAQREIPVFRIIPEIPTHSTPT